VIHVEGAYTRGHIIIVFKEVRDEDTAAPWLLSSVILSVLKASPNLNVPTEKGNFGAHINTYAVVSLVFLIVTIMVTLHRFFASYVSLPI